MGEVCLQNGYWLWQNQGDESCYRVELFPCSARKRITSHQRVMVLNDEAHHVWDPDSAWNEAISYLHRTIRQRNSSDDGICAQLDFSATPKDNKGQYFQYIVCDSPLGEAVDAGI